MEFGDRNKQLARRNSCWGQKPFDIVWHEIRVFIVFSQHDAHVYNIYLADSGELNAVCLSIVSRIYPFQNSNLIRSFIGLNPGRETFRPFEKSFNYFVRYIRRRSCVLDGNREGELRTRHSILCVYIYRYIYTRHIHSRISSPLIGLHFLSLLERVRALPDAAHQFHA